MFPLIFFFSSAIFLLKESVNAKGYTREVKANQWPSEDNFAAETPVEIDVILCASPPFKGNEYNWAASSPSLLAVK